MFHSVCILNSQCAFEITKQKQLSILITCSFLNRQTSFLVSHFASSVIHSTHRGTTHYLSSCLELMVWALSLREYGILMPVRACLFGTLALILSK